MTEESYEERLDKRLTYVDELKARIAELESEAAAFDTALWSGRLQEVEQYNVNANARIAELEAQVAEMKPLVETVGKLEEWLDDGLGMRRIRLFGKDYKGYTAYLDGETGKAKMGPAADRPYTTVARAPTLSAALVALSKEVEGG